MQIIMMLEAEQAAYINSYMSGLAKNECNSQLLRDFALCYMKSYESGMRQAMADVLEFDEHRADMIGHNSNEGLHYEEVDSSR